MRFKRGLLMLTAIGIWLPLTLSATPTPALNEFYWSAVNTTVNGAPLENLAGYRIYCTGNPQQPYALSFEVPNPLTTSLPVTDVVHNDGQYYCAITAYTTTGLESNYSQQISFFMNEGQVTNPAIPAAPGSFGVR